MGGRSLARGVRCPTQSLVHKLNMISSTVEYYPVHRHGHRSLLPNKDNVATVLSPSPSPGPQT